MRVTFIDPDGQTHNVTGEPGESAMRCATNHLVPGIVGECGGAMACATCHIAVDPAWIDKVGRARGEELDLLDNSDYRTEFSRLSCQITVKDALDGLKVELQLDAFED